MFILNKDNWKSDINKDVVVIDNFSIKNITIINAKKIIIKNSFIPSNLILKAKRIYIYNCTLTKLYLNRVKCLYVNKSIIDDATFSLSDYNHVKILGNAYFSLLTVTAFNSKKFILIQNIKCKNLKLINHIWNQNKFTDNSFMLENVNVEHFKSEYQEISNNLIKKFV